MSNNSQFSKAGWTRTLFEMDLIISNLRSHGIDAHRIDNDAIENEGDNYFELFVRNEHIEQAAAIIKELDILDFIEIKQD